MSVLTWGFQTNNFLVSSVPHKEKLNIHKRYNLFILNVSSVANTHGFQWLTPESEQQCDWWPKLHWHTKIQINNDSWDVYKTNPFDKWRIGWCDDLKIKSSIRWNTGLSLSLRSASLIGLSSIFHPCEPLDLTQLLSYGFRRLGCSVSCMEYFHGTFRFF